MVVCPICLDNVPYKNTASPDTCDHIFCLTCLQKWSKQGSFCPVDRKRYKRIINLESEELIQVKPRKRKKSQVLYDITVYCEICSKANLADKLLLCDCCDLGYHCQCLTPPVSNIPSGQWFCPSCLAVDEKLKKKKGITKEVECSGNEGSSHGFQDRKKSGTKKGIRNNKTESKYMIQGRKGTTKKATQNNTTENRYMHRETRARASKERINKNTTESKYMFRERRKRISIESMSLEDDEYFGEVNRCTSNEKIQGSTTEGKHIYEEKKDGKKEAAHENRTEDNENQNKEVKEGQCSENTVLHYNHVESEKIAVEFNKHVLEEPKVILKKVELYNFLPSSSSTQKEMKSEEVTECKSNPSSKKIQDLENNSPCHPSRNLKSLQFSVFEKVDDINDSKQKYSTINSVSSKVNQNSLPHGIVDFSSISESAHERKQTIFSKSNQIMNDGKKFLPPCVHLKDFKHSLISNVHTTCQNLQCAQCNLLSSGFKTAFSYVKKYQKDMSANQNSLFQGSASHSIVQNNNLTQAKILSKELKKIKREKKVKHWQSAKLKCRSDAYKTLIEYLSSNKIESKIENHQTILSSDSYGHKDFSAILHRTTNILFQGIK